MELKNGIVFEVSSTDTNGRVSVSRRGCFQHFLFGLVPEFIIFYSRSQGESSLIILSAVENNQTIAQDKEYWSGSYPGMIAAESSTCCSQARASWTSNLSATPLKNSLEQLQGNKLAVIFEKLGLQPSHTAFQG